MVTTEYLPVLAVVIFGDPQPTPKRFDLERPKTALASPEPQHVADSDTHCHRQRLIAAMTLIDD